MICTRYGGEKAGIDYLLRNPTAKILAGDPVWVSAMITAIRFKQRFMSGSISWDPGEIPSEGELDEVIDYYTRHLTRDRDIPLLWVQHEKKRKGSDERAIHIHFVLPQVDPETGKLFQPYFDGNDRSRFDNLCEGLNAKFDWNSSNKYKGALARDERLLMLLAAEKQLKKRKEKDAVRYRHAPRQLRNLEGKKSKKIKKLALKPKKRDKSLHELCRRIIRKSVGGVDGLGGRVGPSVDEFGERDQKIGFFIGSIHILNRKIRRAVEHFQEFYRVVEEANQRIGKLYREFEKWKNTALKPKEVQKSARTKSAREKDSDSLSGIQL